MLKIKIERCPDEDLIGEHITYFQKILFGRNKTNDFIIKSNETPEKAISLHCNEKGIFVKTRELDHFLSNGKKVKGEKVHKLGDKIEFAGTVIEFLEYDNSSTQKPISEKEILEELEQLDGPAAEVAKDIKNLLDKK